MSELTRNLLIAETVANPGVASICRSARLEIERLREALQFYTDNENWRLDGPLDGNSGNFTGGPAKAALAAIDSVEGE